ncbi:MAG: type II toxin-antitoxin system VapC family toxin [Gammaproteobacteria bacterium]|nr:type II toxin-antitoxin system VapC family toxin [Gammaproteobacteria bacterium]
MRLLIDTHIFLWLIFSPTKISRHILDILEDPYNEVCLSSISLWEISLKYSLGRLSLSDAKPEDFPELASKMGINCIPLDAQVSSSFHNLPRLEHKDPFDRMLVWQAITGDYNLVSMDGDMSKYESYGLKLI